MLIMPPCPLVLTLTLSRLLISPARMDGSCRLVLVCCWTFTEKPTTTHLSREHTHAMVPIPQQHLAFSLCLLLSATGAGSEKGEPVSGMKLVSVLKHACCQKLTEAGYVHVPVCMYAGVWDMMPPYICGTVWACQCAFTCLCTPTCVCMSAASSP